MFLIVLIFTQFLVATTKAEYVWNGSEWTWKDPEVRTYLRIKIFDERKDNIMIILNAS